MRVTALAVYPLEGVRRGARRTCLGDPVEALD